MISDDERGGDPVAAVQSPELTGGRLQVDITNSNVDGTRAVLNQADALMRRHRVFVAGADRSTEAASSFDSSLAADDLPILTEVVASPSLDTKISAKDLALLRQHQRATISSGLDRWADSELPAVIQDLLGDLTEKLVATLTTSAKTELLERLLKELDGSRQR